MEKELLTDDYLESSKLQEVLNGLFDRLVILRPADPVYWLAHHNDPETSVAKKRVFPMKKYHLPSNQPLFMNGMFQVESYIADKKIDLILLEILEESLEKRPENINKFIASWAEQRLADHDAEIGSFSAGDTDDLTTEEDFGDDGGEGSERSSTLSSFVDSSDSDTDEVTSSEDGSDFSVSKDDEEGHGHHHHHHHHRGVGGNPPPVMPPLPSSPPPPHGLQSNSSSSRKTTTSTTAGGDRTGGKASKVTSDSPVKQFPPRNQPQAHFDPTLV